MNKKLKLSTSLSLRSIASQALRAAAISIAERKNEKSKPKKKIRKRPLSEIEQTMVSIKNDVQARVPKELVAVFDVPGKMSSAHSILTLYKRDEYELYHSFGAKRKKPKAVFKYVFYSSSINLDVLGSIAVYGKEVDQYYRQLIDCRNIFGIPYQKVKIEMGLRPYLDVKIRS